MPRPGDEGDHLRSEVEALRQEIAELRQELEALRVSAAMYRECVESVNSIVLRWDPDGRITFLNDYALRFFDYAAEDIIGRSVLDVIVPPTETSGRDLTNMIADILAHPEVYVDNENENVRRNGERVWITWRNRPIMGPDGKLREILSTGIDTTQRKRAEEQLRANEERFRQLALEDGLTGLYNRRYLYEAMQQMIGACALAGACFSLIFMDLDDFKRVVDAHGHPNGSRVIQEVASTIRALIEPPAFAVAYAGDEFVVVLPTFTKDQALDKAEEIRRQVDAAIYLADGPRVHVSASLGVAAYPDDATELEALLALADHALFGIKRRGKNAVGTGLSGPLRARSNEPSES